jgi:hypothetical protein
MPDDICPTDESSAVSLASGILSDAQELFRQQLALFKAELRDDMRKAREAARTLFVGMGLGFCGLLLLLFACAHLLNWAIELPAWASFGIVGGVVLAIGLAMMVLGKKRLGSFLALPEQSMQALRENVQWITNQR